MVVDFQTLVDFRQGQLAGTEAAKGQFVILEDPSFFGEISVARVFCQLFKMYSFLLYGIILLIERTLNRSVSEADKIVLKGKGVNKWLLF